MKMIEVDEIPEVSKETLLGHIAILQEIIEQLRDENNRLYGTHKILWHQRHPELPPKERVNKYFRDVDLSKPVAGFVYDIINWLEEAEQIGMERARRLKELS